MARPLVEWIARRRARLERLPQLEASLLSGRTGRYLGLRMLPLLANRVFGYALHLFEAVLLARFLEGPLLIRSFVVATLCRLVVAMHWSATEVLRSDLRRLPSKSAVMRTQSAWLSGAAGIALALGVLMSIAAHLAIEGGASEWLAELYAVVVIGRMSLDLVVRTYYSCAYAFGRVYRPFVAIWAPQLAAFAALLLGAYLAGPLGVIAAIALAAPVSRVITIVYATRALRTHRRALPLVRWRLFARQTFDARRIALASVSGLFARAGQIAVLLIAVETHDFRRVAVGYFLAPIVGAAAATVQIFYPDIKRLEGALSLILLRRFVRSLVIASVLAALFWLGVGWLVFRLLLTTLFPVTLEVPILLSVLTLAVSVAAVVQLVLLAREQFGALLAHGLLLLGIAVWPQAPVLATALLIASVVLGLVRIFARLPDGALPPAIAAAEQLTGYELDLLPQGQSRRRALVDRLSGELPHALCLIEHRRLVVLVDTRTPLQPIDLVVPTGGLVHRLRRLPPFPRAELSRRLGRAATSATELSQIVARARVLAPDMTVIDLQRPGTAIATPLLPALWREALARAHGRPLRAQRAYHVAPVLEGAAIRALCLISKDVPAATVQAWRAEIRGT